MTRTAVAKFGRYGATVNVFATTVDGEAVARVEWREFGRRRTQTFRGAKRERENAAKAYAEGIAARLRHDEPAKPARLTVGQLWDAYTTAHGPDWRPKTATLNAHRWRVFTAHVNPLTYADLIQPETLDSWRKALLETPTAKTRQPMARNQVAHHIQLVKSVWRFARGRKLLADNPIADYAVRKGRDYLPKDIPEFSADEWRAIFAQLSFRSMRSWRAWAALSLDALLAPRSLALLKLRWADVDLRRRVVTWQGGNDKVGKTREQPLPRDAVFVLRVCRVWARREGYAGDFVFFGAQQRTRATHWGYSALNAQLRAASDRAGLPWVPYRAMHGLRRMVAGNVLTVTGDITKVGDFLGDSDVRVLRRSYLKNRPDQLKAVADRMSLPK